MASLRKRPAPAHNLGAGAIDPAEREDALPSAHHVHSIGCNGTPRRCGDRVNDNDNHENESIRERPVKVRRMDAKVSIASLPPEIVVAILALIDDGPTFVACHVAARLFWAYSAVDFALARVPSRALVTCGAPPAIARAVFARRADAPCWSMLPLAAESGSIGTVEWVAGVLCDHYACDNLLRVEPTVTVHHGVGNQDRCAGDPQAQRDDTDRDYTYGRLADFIYQRPLISRMDATGGDPLDPWDRYRNHVNVAACVAARAGHLDIVAYLHETFRKPGSICGCSSGVGNVAFDAVRVNVLEWLAAAGCDGRYRTDHLCVPTAVDKCDLALVEWAARAADPWHRSITWSVAYKPAARNDVAMVDLVVRLGLYRPSPDDVGVAAASGSLDVIRWAAGEAVAGVVEAHDGPRVAGWCTTDAVIQAADKGRMDVVRWFVDHPHATHFVDASAAKRALSNDHREVVRFLHEAGRADFGRWDALGTAVKTGNLAMVSFVADNGGVYRPKVLVAALKTKHAGIVGFLCDRYALGASDIVDAIHIVNESYDAEYARLVVERYTKKMPAMAPLWTAVRDHLDEKEKKE
ncbi:Ankyrin repeat domain containing protein [Pandoravirus dulcis]|uniref:Ankyrin repeat domain containing protein n=1 Tax=Pandoravirus dulcis TaxID=1349409 RepID=S4VZ52_9VIRU|nr:Ankyrin repeat domain containing protein [Pandoravirus dulcis]AGO83326.1 Ankyrin repeat domain containing protein [Pandoravirus dulcis]